MAISIHGTGGNIGTSLMPLLQSAVVTVAGWRTAVGACALPAAVLLPLIGVRFSGKADAESERPQGNPRQRLGILTSRVLKNRNVVLLALVYALKGLGSKGAIGFLPLLAVQRFSMDTAAIGVAVSVYYTVGLVGKPLMGSLYNRWGARLALLAPLLFTGVFALGIGFLSWAPALIPLAALLGVVSPISPIILTAAADLSDEEILASSVGFIYTCYGLGFLSPLVGGWLASGRGSLVASYAFFALVTWVGAGVSAMLPSTRGSDKAQERSRQLSEKAET
jgi:nitrate/nitrite transporter NarK